MGWSGLVIVGGLAAIGGCGRSGGAKAAALRDPVAACASVVNNAGHFDHAHGHTGTATVGGANATIEPEVASTTYTVTELEQGVVIARILHNRGGSNATYAILPGYRTCVWFGRPGGVWTIKFIALSPNNTVGAQTEMDGQFETSTDAHPYPWADWKVILTGSATLADSAEAAFDQAIPWGTCTSHGCCRPQ